MNWTDLPTKTSLREDGAKVGAFPGDGRMEFWAYPAGWSRSADYAGADPQGPFATMEEAKASLGNMLDLF